MKNNHCRNAMKTHHLPMLVALALVASLNHASAGQIGTTFTYQGQLMATNTSGPLTGSYEFLFRLCNTPDVFGIQQELHFPAVNVNYSLFTVPLTFAPPFFNGQELWLEVAVRPAGSTVDYQVLSPRVYLTLSPYAIFAENAATFAGIPPGGFWGTSGNSGTIPGNNFLGTTDLEPLEFRVNNILTLLLDANNNIVGGGNTIGAGATSAFIGGGSGNTVSAQQATIGGGYINVASGQRTTVAGGADNIATNYYDTVCGGADNIAGGSRTFVGGGTGNHALGVFATIGGGENSSVSSDHGTIGGGLQNTCAGAEDTIAGGQLNSSTGGGWNNAIGGGNQNTIANGAALATIGGGYQNSIQNSIYETVGGGSLNTSLSEGATVGGGVANSASGAYATVPGGHANVASGNHSFAAGHRAMAQNKGSFVWADSQEKDEISLHDDEVVFRCLQGARFEDGSGNYAQWIPGGADWHVVSDRNKKEHFSPVDPQAVLDKVVSLEVEEWNYKGYPQRHIGPMAQDFHKLFPLNDDDKTLSGLDLNGIELAAIKGLNRKLEDQRAALAAKEAQIEELRQRLDQVEKLVRHSEDYASH
jgi:hypothetical protein